MPPHAYILLGAVLLIIFKDNQFLVGQAVRLLQTPGPNDLFLEWSRRWPDAPFIRCLTWLNSEILLVNNLEACRDVLQTNAYSFVKPSFFEILVGEIIGIGILFSHGDQHRRLRRIIAGNRTFQLTRVTSDIDCISSSLSAKCSKTPARLPGSV